MINLIEYLVKEAEASNTYVMPATPTVGKKVGGEKAVINKVAEELPDDNLKTPVAGEQPKKNVQSGPLTPHVSVEGKEPPVLIKENQAKHYALPSLGKYPLDRYDHVVKAASYFDEWGNSMGGRHRHEYCENLVKRASVLGVPLSQVIQKYGSVTYAPSTEIDIALEGRRSVIVDGEHQQMLDKLASLQPTMPPDDFVVALSEFDKIAGIEHLYDEHIIDPYYSVYGIKTANTDSTEDQDTSFVLGNEIVTAKQLKEFASTHSKDITDTFGAEFMKEFKDDPVGIFSSLPMDQKKVICRQANDNSPS